MTLAIKTLFGPHERHLGIPRINIALLRLLFTLMFFLLGRDAWTQILTHAGPWEPLAAAAWSVWAAFALLAGIGIFRPLEMLPLVLLEIVYKLIWLLLVAYPLWAANQLVGSPAEPMTINFLWVILPIAAVPWKYAFETYILNRR